MQEKYLILIAFLFSLIGLMGLFILSLTLEESVSEDMVIFSGKVEEVSHYGNMTFFSIGRPIEAVVFQNVSLYEGEIVEIVGKEDEEGIVVERLRVINSFQ
ncbi:hypothetical protein GOV09_05215 [Candidatus Woesearchaeota archaeon]|nr:hypothetical protein [Candidatus Woesearchaeota archaeon]